MRNTLDSIEERYFGLMGLKDEAVAKARLYVSQAEADPSRILEVQKKLNELSTQLARYKKELTLIKQDWDEIKFEYGIT
jgi:DNA repair ATPase RecN